jgi:hypothetical protein
LGLLDTRKLATVVRWDEKVSPITAGVKLAVIDALKVQSQKMRRPTHEET